MTHTAECIDASERWRERFIAPDYDKAVGLPSVVRNDPDAVVAWFTCGHPSHVSARLAFLLCATTMPLAADIVTRIKMTSVGDDVA